MKFEILNLYVCRTEQSVKKEKKQKQNFRRLKSNIFM